MQRLPLQHTFFRSDERLYHDLYFDYIFVDLGDDQQSDGIHSNQRGNGFPWCCRDIFCIHNISPAKSIANQSLLRWLNTVLTVCEYMSVAKSWQEKGCNSQAKTWQVEYIVMKEFDWQVKCDVFVVSMATWAINYNLQMSLLLSLHKFRSLYFLINLYTAYYN